MDTMMVDGVLIALLIFALFWGWQNGLIKVLAGPGSVILAYQIARNFSSVAAELLTAPSAAAQPQSQDQPLIHLLSLFIDTGAIANRLVEIVLFIVLFILIRWLVRKAAGLLTGVLGSGVLSKSNKALGGFAAVVLAGVLILILVQIVLPALSGLGLGGGLLQYLSASRWVIPGLSYCIALV